jgi:hypothetical protein
LRQQAAVGECDKFHFTFEFEVHMLIQILQRFERDQIPICYLLNKSNPNTDKPNTFKLDQI